MHEGVGRGGAALARTEIREVRLQGSDPLGCAPPVPGLSGVCARVPVRVSRVCVRVWQLEEDRQCVSITVCQELSGTVWMKNKVCEGVCEK